MLNSVGLQGPGISAWIEDELPALQASGAAVVVSIWGRRVEDYAQAAVLLADAPECVVALEVNVSCPNVEDRSKMFAHSPVATAEVLAATAAFGRPRWAKLSPNVADLAEIADAALSAGAEALTLINTVLGLAIDPKARTLALGAGRGGLSGPAIRPVALRAVYDCREAFPEAAIVGVGGVVSGLDAAELIMAGANAVQVGTATFEDPRAPLRVQRELISWCAKEGVTDISELVGVAQR
jgi:dihydroorotate dehydrogenase (NAD+) catalytic subunit